MKYSTIIIIFQRKKVGTREGKYNLPTIITELWI